jgi:murein DD-endopeptidase MepM/ murein hydrolase activator NlpD
MALLGQLSPDGTTRREDLLRVIGPFPVAGLASWTDDWHAFRCCPSAHLHEGLDLFAEEGTPVIAVAEGRITQKVSGHTSGLAVELTTRGGTEYFYAHLSAFAPGLQVGQQVDGGEVLGYVGDTGNARGTSPHLHFEIQPGGQAIPPKPIVDRWLVMAERRAEALVEQVLGRAVSLDPAEVRVLQARADRLIDGSGADAGPSAYPPPPRAAAGTGSGSWTPVVGLLGALLLAVGLLSRWDSGEPEGSIMRVNAMRVALLI